MAQVALNKASVNSLDTPKIVDQQQQKRLPLRIYNFAKEYFDSTKRYVLTFFTKDQKQPKVTSFNFSQLKREIALSLDDLDKTLFMQIKDAINKRNYRNLDELLKKIENIKDYSLILSLHKFCENKNMPVEIKNLINERLNKLSKNLIKNKKFGFINFDDPRYKLIKKIVAGVFIFACASTLAYGLYSFFKPNQSDDNQLYWNYFSSRYFFSDAKDLDWSILKKRIEADFCSGWTVLYGPANCSSEEINPISQSIDLMKQNATSSSYNNEWILFTLPMLYSVKSSNHLGLIQEKKITQIFWDFVSSLLPSKNFDQVEKTINLFKKLAPISSIG